MSYTLDQLEAFVSSAHYDAQTAGLIARGIPALKAAGTPGELISPGVRRIRSNLCNVHGRYGPCDKALSGKKKPAKGRQPPKAKLTPAQRAQARTQQRQTNIDDVAKRMAATDTGLGPSGSRALSAFAQGTQPDAATGAALVKGGLAEQGADGSFRMTPSGRAVVNAMAAGDYQRAIDGLSRAADTVAGRQGRAQERTARQTAAQGKRTAAVAERSKRRAEREAAQRAKKPAKASAGGSKKPGKPSPAKRPARQQRRGTASGATGSVGTPKPEKPAKAPAKQITPALQTAADQLSQGATLSDADAQALIRNGMARLNKEGELILTSAGMRATTKAAPAHTGVMVAFYPDPAAAKQIAAQQGVTEPIDTLHMTLAFLGDSSETALATNKDKLSAAVKQWAAEKGKPLEGTVNGLGRFFHSEDDDTNAVFVSPDVPGLPELRQSLVEWIGQSGFDYAQNHGFTPHITVAYVPLDAPTPAIRVETPITFDRVTLAWGDERYDYPLGMAARKETSFRIFKDANGRYRWVAQSSTAFQDRDKEIVSTKALADDCRWADKTGSYGPLRWWHTPGLDLGDCDFNAMHGRVLIESGTFRSAAIAQKVARAANGLEISLGFLHLPNEPDAAGVFHHIRRFERSLVPRGKASNRFTAFRVKEIPMLDAIKVAALKTLGFSDDDITSLQTQAAATEKAAADQGVAYKSDDVPRTPGLHPGNYSGEFVDGSETLPDLVINGVTYKAFPPKADVAIVEDVIEEDAIEDMPMEEEAPDDPTALTLSSGDLSAIQEMIGAAIGQIMGGLDLEKKVAGHVQGLLAPYQATKDAEQAATKEQLAALSQQVAELTGDQPAARVYRPSAAPDNVITDATMLAAVKQIADPNANDPWADIKHGLGLG